MIIEKFNLRHPFLDTSHLLLSLLKIDNNIQAFFLLNGLSYDMLKTYIIKSIGCGSKVSNIILYTPLLRDIYEIKFRSKNNINFDDAAFILIKILSNHNSIAYNLLNNMNINIEKILNELKNNKNFKELNFYFSNIYNFSLNNFSFKSYELEFLKYRFHHCIYSILNNKTIYAFLDNNILECFNNNVDDFYFLDVLLRHNILYFK